MKKEKSQFKSGPIRELSDNETLVALKVKAVLEGKSDSENIANIPFFLSNDDRNRLLIFSNTIAKKIQRDHGDIDASNLAICATDWDIAIKNLKSVDERTGSMIINPDKLNLIKRIPNSDNFLLIGANRDNGFFMVTYYETIPRYGNELKSLLGRGDLIGPSGKPLAPEDFLFAPPHNAFLLGVSGSGDI